MSEFISGRRAGQRRTHIPTFEELAADPEIAALLEFDPVPRTAQAARRLDRAAAEAGSSPSLRKAARRRSPPRRWARNCSAPPGCTRRSAPTAFGRRGTARSRCSRNERLPEAMRTMPGCRAQAADGRPPADENPSPEPPPRPRGRRRDDEDDDQASLHARGEEARDSISAKLLNCRRLYLQEISTCPGKRAAFEILTQYPIDWDRAARCEAQDDEPWRSPNMREPEMLLTAENGWMGDMVHGPDKKAELRRAMDQHRAADGLPAHRVGRRGAAR